MRILVILVVILLLAPMSTSFDESSFGISEKQHKEAWASWPTVMPILNMAFEDPIHIGIQTLNGVPANVYVEVDFSHSVPGITYKLKMRCSYSEDGDYLRFKFEIDFDRYSEDDKNSLNYVGPLALLGLFLDPPAALEFGSAFDCGLGIGGGGSITLIWDRSAEEWIFPDYSFEVDLYYTIRANLLKLFVYTICPGLGMLGYELANTITLDKLDNLALAQASIGVRFRHTKEGDVYRYTLEPYASIGLDVPHDDSSFNLIEFHIGAEFNGQFSYVWGPFVTDNLEIGTNFEVSFTWRVLSLSGDHRWEFYKEFVSIPLVDTRTELKELSIADEEFTCTQGDTVNLEAKLVDSEGDGIAGQVIHFEYLHTTLGWQHMASTTTVAGGVCTTSWACGLANGTHTVRAYYDGQAGVYDAATSPETSIIVTLDLTELYILDLGFGTPEDCIIVRPGEQIHITTFVSAQGEGAVEGLPIKFFISDSERTHWEYIGSDLTSIGWGLASIDWTVPADMSSGNHYFRAAYPGDYSYTPAVSDAEIRLVIESVKITSPQDGDTVGTSTPTIEIEIPDGIVYDSIVFRIDWDSFVPVPVETREW
ncbi:MAG: hypothetical protein ACW98Y_22020, partial [Candidatus Thorarchaeota archaeon]